VKNPGFAAVVVLTLAIGIGANTTVFSWIRAVLLDAVPGARDPGRLVVLCPRHVSGRLNDTTSLLDNRDLAADSAVFEGVAGSRYDAVALRLGEELAWVWAEASTANFFDVLGITPRLGRFFLPDEDTHPGGDNVVVLSHSLWQRRFGGDMSVLGRVVEIANRPFTVIGVAPENFFGGMGGLRFDMWIPLTMTPELNDPAEALQQRTLRMLHTYARLRPGVNVAQAQAAATSVMVRSMSSGSRFSRVRWLVWKVSVISAPFTGRALPAAGRCSSWRRVRSGAGAGRCAGGSLPAPGCRGAR